MTSLLTNKETEAHERVAQLVGSKCKVKCYIHSYAVDCLLDTGAQLSLLDHQWVKTYLPEHELRPLAEFWLNSHCAGCQWCTVAL